MDLSKLQADFAEKKAAGLAKVKMSPEEALKLRKAKSQLDVKPGQHKFQIIPKEEPFDPSTWSPFKRGPTVDEAAERDGIRKAGESKAQATFRARQLEIRRAKQTEEINKWRAQERELRGSRMDEARWQKSMDTSFQTRYDGHARGNIDYRTAKDRKRLKVHESKERKEEAFEARRLESIAKAKAELGSTSVPVYIFKTTGALFDSVGLPVVLSRSKDELKLLEEADLQVERKYSLAPPFLRRPDQRLVLEPNGREIESGSLSKDAESELDVASIKELGKAKCALAANLLGELVVRDAWEHLEAGKNGTWFLIVNKRTRFETAAGDVKFDKSEFKRKDARFSLGHLQFVPTMKKGLLLPSIVDIFDHCIARLSTFDSVNGPIVFCRATIKVLRDRVKQLFALVSLISSNEGDEKTIKASGLPKFLATPKSGVFQFLFEFMDAMSAGQVYLDLPLDWRGSRDVTFDDNATFAALCVLAALMHVELVFQM